MPSRKVSWATIKKMWVCVLETGRELVSLKNCAGSNDNLWHRNPGWGPRSEHQRKSVSRIPGVPRAASGRYYLSVSHHRADHLTCSMFITAGIGHVCSAGIGHVCSAVPGVWKSETPSFFPMEFCVYCSIGLWRLSEKPVPLPPHHAASLKVSRSSDFHYSLWLLYQNPLNT